MLLTCVCLLQDTIFLSTTDNVDDDDDVDYSVPTRNNIDSIPNKNIVDSSWSCLLLHLYNLNVFLLCNNPQEQHIIDDNHIDDCNCDDNHHNTSAVTGDVLHNNVKKVQLRYIYGVDIN